MAKSVPENFTLVKDLTTLRVGERVWLEEYNSYGIIVDRGEAERHWIRYSGHTPSYNKENPNSKVWIRPDVDVEGNPYEHHPLHGWRLVYKRQSYCGECLALFIDEVHYLCPDCR